MEPEFKSFKEFYPVYLGEHKKPLTRALHVLGIFLAMSWTWLSVFSFTQPLWIFAALIFGYGPSWIGHFFVEKNWPATFKHPLYSLAGDFRMTFDILKNRKLLFESGT